MDTTAFYAEAATAHTSLATSHIETEAVYTENATARTAPETDLLEAVEDRTAPMAAYTSSVISLA